MLQFCYTQLPIRFRNRALAMGPFGLDPIEPRALDRQGTHHHTAAASLLDMPVVRLEPRPHGLADVPRGIVPDQQQGGFAFGGHNQAVSHARNCVVTALTGRPSTKRRSMPCVSARSSP